MIAELLSPDLYTETRLHEINLVRSGRRLKPLRAEQTTPSMFRRLFANPKVTWCPQSGHDMVHRCESRAQAAIQIYSDLLEDYKICLSAGADESAFQPGGVIDLRLGDHGLSVAIDVQSPVTLHEINTISELYDTTSRKLFFAVFVGNGHIVGHETCLKGVVEAIVHAAITAKQSSEQ